MPRVQPEP
jgi:hypothetical protein